MPLPPEAARAFAQDLLIASGESVGIMTRNFMAAPFFHGTT